MFLTDWSRWVKLYVRFTRYDPKFCEKIYGKIFFQKEQKIKDMFNKVYFYFYSHLFSNSVRNEELENFKKINIDWSLLKLIVLMILSY
jgi:hypothetical protein